MMGHKEDSVSTVFPPSRSRPEQGSQARWERLQARFPGVAKSLHLVNQIGSTVITAGALLVNNEKAKRELSEMYEDMGQFETGK